MGSTGTHHIQGLQSLRGLAALVVLVHHCFRVPADADYAWFASEYLLNAHAAVVLFFVLSGYVLGLSLLKSNFTAEAVAKFYVRRAFRIYPALWLGVLIGAGYFLLFRDHPRDGFTAWAGGLYTPDKINATATVTSFLGIGTELLPPLWTIKNELVASVLLPFMVVVMRNSWGAILAVLALVLLSFKATTSVPLYLVQFSLGLTCAIYSDRLWRGLRFGEASFWAAALVLMFFRVADGWEYHNPLPSLVEGLAAVVVIGAVVHGRAKFLGHRTLVYLGDRSYGLYLFHLPIALGVGALLGIIAVPVRGDVSAVLIASGTLAGTIVIAHLSFAYVEQPFVSFGRKASGKFGSMFRFSAA